MEQEQLKLLKLLKGRFEPKALVAGKREPAVLLVLAEKTTKLGTVQAVSGTGAASASAVIVILD